jgi:formylglycine-generating enzyme required for sulfatase activity
VVSAVSALLLGFLLTHTATGQATGHIVSARRNPRDGLFYQWIPPGSFLMGCSAGDHECFREEMPPHSVTISKGFWIGQTEVTVGAYKKFARLAESNKVDAQASAHQADADDSMPIVVVTWDEARDYCNWEGGRLPTEAEWEYAARGGSSAARYAVLDRIAWYQKNSDNRTHPVSRKLPNGFGLFDVLGNAWEWVNDWYDGTYYSKSPNLDPTGPDNGTMHVLRGGSWMNTANLLRVSDRGRSNADLRFNYFGIRCIWNQTAP